MKSFRSTAIFALVVALVVGFAIWDYFSQKKQEVEDQQARRILQVDVAQASGLKIERDPDHLVLEKQGEIWLSKSPIEDRLEDFAVETLLRSVLEQEALDISAQARGGGEQGQAVRWSEYGLDKPMARFVISWVSDNQELQTIAVDLGSVQAYDGRYYMRRGEDLLLVEEAWTGLVETNLNGLRDKRVWRDPEVVNQVEIQHRGQTVASVLMNHESGAWEYTEEQSFSVEGDLVESLIQRVKGLRMGSFVAEDQQVQTLKLYSLERPEWKLSLDDWSLDISFPPEGNADGEGATTLFAKTSSENFVFSVSGSQVKSLTKTNLDLRDRSEPFQFELLKVSQVRIAQGEESLRINKLGSDWTVAGEEETALSREALVDFFEGLALLRADSFMPSALQASTKLPEDNLIELLDSEGDLVLKLSWGSSFEHVESGRDMVHMHSSQSRHLMLVPASQLEILSLEKLTQ